MHTIFDQPASEEVHIQRNRVMTGLETKYPDAAHLDEARDDLLAFTGFPREVWRPDPLTESCARSLEMSVPRDLLEHAFD